MAIFFYDFLVGDRGEVALAEWELERFGRLLDNNERAVLLAGGRGRVAGLGDKLVFCGDQVIATDEGPGADQETGEVLGVQVAFRIQ